MNNIPPFVVPALLAAVGTALLCCGTAYAKTWIVLAAVRSAIGIHELLPAIAVHTMALFVALATVGGPALQVAERVQAQQTALHCTWPQRLAQTDQLPMTAVQDRLCTLDHALAPWTAFLAANTAPDEAARAEGLLDPSTPPWIRHWVGFTWTELSEALLLVIVLLLPFYAVDVVAALLATFAGLPALVADRAATTAKVLLLVAVGAWGALSEGLILGYVMRGGP
jgi:type III secretory pathway component EscR